MQSKLNLSSLVLAIFIGGCTSVNVNQIPSAHKLSYICIKNNPKVIVKDFVPVVQKEFASHNIKSEVYDGKKPAHCAYHMTYTALQSWDLTLYMSHAELHLFKGTEQIADAEYHLKGKGGFALTKFNSVETKMKPVIKKLLSGQ